MSDRKNVTISVKQPPHVPRDVNVRAHSRHHHHSPSSDAQKGHVYAEGDQASQLDIKDREHRGLRNPSTKAALC